jgi:hypothetical protein
LKKLTVVTILSFLSVLSRAHLTASAVWCVQALGFDPNSGESWQSHFRRIPFTLAAAQIGDENWAGRRTFHHQSTFQINKAVDKNGGYFGIKSQKNIRYYEETFFGIFLSGKG